MAVATKKDEDLLILPTEDNSTDTIILDNTMITEEITPTEESDIISFDDDSSIKSKKDEESLELIEDDNSDDVLDLGDLSIDNSEEMEKSTKIDNSEEALDLSIDFLEEDDNSTKLEKDEKLDLNINEDLSSSENEDFNLGTVTAEYVSKLEKRKGQIGEEIKKDEDYISDKEEQIKKIKLEISELKKAINEGNSENEEIDNKIGLVSTGSKITKK